RERRLGVGPRHLELFRSAYGIPLFRRHHAEEALFPHHLHARNVLDRGLVDRGRHRARHWRTDHAPVHHAGHLHVDPVFELAEHLGCHIAAAYAALAHDLVLARRLWLGLALDLELVAEVLVPFELHVEVLAADQLAVAYLLAGIALVADHA